MNRSLRSKQGCWTCRLRKKKCDEKHPVCSTCSSLAIICYGYGLKPAWMDNGEKEKAMANSIKQTVKETSKRKGRSGGSVGRLQKQYHQGQKNDYLGSRLAPKPAGHSPWGASSSGDSTNAEHKPSTRDNYPPTQVNNPSTVPNLLADSVPENDKLFPSSSLLPTIPGTEAVLLMHFLDTVFPMQYPMYKPGLIEGGRGWLLSLLLRTKPFYHTALALSAYHRKASLPVACSTTSLTQQETHLSTCSTELQQAITNVDRWVKEANLNEVPGTIASILQLIFLEIFSSHGGTWQIHLRAAIDVFRKPCKDRWATPGLVEPSTTLISKAKPAEHNLPVSEETVVFRFLSAVVLWLDIISCITTGRSPRLLSVHSDTLSPSSQIRLENIMGCENWVVLQMGRIAALQEYKTQASHNAADFNNRADTISKELRHHLTQGFLDSIRITNSNPAAPKPVEASPTLVTRIYALGAFIYLHVVASGFQTQTEELSTTVWEAMALLRTLFPANSIHAIVCPLYIIGSVVRSDKDKDFFRIVFSKPPLLVPSLAHRNTILPLLEDIWRMRETSVSGWTWEDSLRLSNHNLLLL